MGNSVSSTTDQGAWIAVAANDSPTPSSDSNRSLTENKPPPAHCPSMTAGSEINRPNTTTPTVVNQSVRSRFDDQTLSAANYYKGGSSMSYRPTVTNFGPGAWASLVANQNSTLNGISNPLSSTNPTAPKFQNHINNFQQQQQNFLSTTSPHPLLVGSSNSNESLFVALHDYTKRVDDDLSMCKGQTFRVKDRSHCDWWYVECVSTGSCGYVPKNHLAAVTSLESNEWYFGELRRIEAEHYLQLPGNDHGSFLVRLSESQTNEYSLSVREDHSIKHYRIRSRPARNDPTLRRFYISRQLPFVTIQQLISHYKENQSGLCCLLIRPCIKPVHPEPIGLSHKLVDKWEISKQSIVLKDKIGQGQFGEVYRALWNKTFTVAVKTLKPSICDAADFLREAQVMKRLHHPNLIQLYAVCTQSEPFYLVTEFMSKGSLLTFLQSSEGHSLATPCLVLMAVHIASGMAYLESMRHIHRDLAARNVLVGEQLNVKIADFGLARMIHNREYVAHAGARFPIKWTAPEAANYSRFTTKSDVWSFGILLTEIMTYGRSPYPGMHNAEVLRQVEAGYRMPKPPGCPPELYDLMIDCWAADEDKRPSFGEVKRRLEEYCGEERPSYRHVSTTPKPTRIPSTRTHSTANSKAVQIGFEVPVSPC